MDEILVWCDTISEIIVDITGKKFIILKSIGYEKARVSVCLVIKVDGIKLKFMVVFKGGKREVSVLK